MLRLTGAVIFLCVLFFSVPCQAVNFYDGARAEGMYLLTYSSLYYADKTTDYEGDTAKKNYAYRKLEELFRLSYYNKELVLSFMAPVGYARSGFYHDSSEGIGDISLGAGYFLPVKSADILPMLFLKVPTGEYDSRKSVNYGSNQYDLRPAIFFYKQIKRFSVDAALKYFFRLKNPSTDVSPGNELHLQGLLGWQFGRFCKAGPSLSWMKSAKQKTGGAAISKSQRETLSVGADLYLKIKSAGLTFTYLRDVRTRNAAKGDFYQLKTCYKF